MDFCKNDEYLKKEILFSPIVKFKTCLTFNVLVKSLKIETARSQTISTIVFPLDFDFGAIDQTNELKLSFEFCVILQGIGS